VPKGDWGKGRVKLTEIPSESEANDNIVAYWVPDQWLAEDHPLVFEYSLRWGFEDPAGREGGRITATRVAIGDREGASRVADATRFLIDFEGEDLAALTADQAPTGVISVGTGGELVDQQIIRNDVTEGWRLVFKVRPPKDQPLELRAFLKNDNATLSETWSYLHEH
jgi:glucans biosynthesis protein